MGLIINKTDFVGAFELSVNVSDTIDAYIEKYEKKYLRELLGAELYLLFEAGITTTPYLELINPLNFDDCERVFQSEGVKKMLIGFLWFEYVRATKYKHSQSGVIEGVNELSSGAKWADGWVYKRYNESVNDYNVIQTYIFKNRTLYPAFNGQRKSITWAI